MVLLGALLAGANVTELKGLQLGAGVEWTSGISNTSSAALTCAAAGGGAAAGACTWVNNTLYSHTIEEPEEVVGERVDVVRNVESGESRWQG